jgi:serine/threonine-protein kinase
MARPELIQPAAPGTPTGLTLARTADRSIPDDLLREASHRLAIMALLAAIMWVAATVLWHLTWPTFHPGLPVPGLRAPDAIVAVASAVSLALYFYIRRAKRDPGFFLDLGLAYMILTCLAIGLVLHWGLPTYEKLQPAISWIGVVVLMFAAIAPNSPRRVLVASLVAASMSPLSMVITRVHGLSAMEALATGALMHYPDFMLAGVSAVIATVVTRLGRQVSKAREMGSYQLGELIKRGGMGEVYHATHRMLARPAAIKLIRSEMLGSIDGESADIAVKRFHREAEAAANLRSPHTVELFDFGITEDQTLYFVMELLEGSDLETLVREHGPLPARRVAHILRQVCESLEEAHSQGLVHRDIKPANIHLGKVGVRWDFVKVLDFGLVKSVVKEDTQISLATAVGRTPGTPSYMAPEMALGEAVDGRADIYALGCVAYFLLTGKLVFDADSTFQMIARHLRNDPVPPSLRGKVEIPERLEGVVMKCLAKNPDDRPQGARDLSAMLDACLLGEWTQEEAQAWWATRQVAAAVASPDGSVRGELAPT